MFLIITTDLSQYKLVIYKVNNFMKRPSIYGKKTLRIAFEFGLVLSEVARQRGVELTEEISIRAEDILIKEIAERGYRDTALNFVPLVLAVLEV